ncbi:MAG: cysteine--tRNA ligase [Sphingomicrobium sp.]
MIRLYDTMAREKLAFEPADPSRITMYVCGPTVYGRAHIGNGRPAVVFDTLARLIRHQYGPDSLIYARNVTDVDDKIIAAAEAEGVEPSVITRRFEDHYLADMGALGVAQPDIAPHATAEIAPMVAMIGELVTNGHAYAAEGHVLFSVASDPDYGSLSRRDREAMLAGARVEVAPYKRDGADFVLWKPSTPEQIGWDSPWGRGRPGWHIECSAMIRAHLGETIDIHGGGLDLIFPHHENELAQSRCAHAGAPLARHWVHNGFVDMGAEKMSKSLGNIVTVEDLLAQGHKGETLRVTLLSSHYRSPLPWLDSKVEQSKAFLDRYYRALEVGGGTVGAPRGDVVEALCNDLDTVKALRLVEQQIDELFAFIKSSSSRLPDWNDNRLASRRSAVDMASAIAGSGSLLGLGADHSAWFGRGDDTTINDRIAARTAAKAARDFATADRIRDELKADGILLEDTPSGTSWRRA